MANDLVITPDFPNLDGRQLVTERELHKMSDDDLAAGALEKFQAAEEGKAEVVAYVQYTAALASTKLPDQWESGKYWEELAGRLKGKHRGEGLTAFMKKNKVEPRSILNHRRIARANTDKEILARARKGETMMGIIRELGFGPKLLGGDGGDRNTGKYTESYTFPSLQHWEKTYSGRSDLIEAAHKANEFCKVVEGIKGEQVAELLTAVSRLCVALKRKLAGKEGKK